MVSVLYHILEYIGYIYHNSISNKTGNHYENLICCLGDCFKKYTFDSLKDIRNFNDFLQRQAKNNYDEQSEDFFQMVRSLLPGILSFYRKINYIFPQEKVGKGKKEYLDCLGCSLNVFLSCRSNIMLGIE
jgi:hypothetical protein